MEVAIPAISKQLVQQLSLLHDMPLTVEREPSAALVHGRAHARRCLLVHLSHSEACQLEYALAARDRVSGQIDDAVVLEASFSDDLDADSLDLVELVMALEETFDITVEEDELEGVDTIGQAYALVTSKI